jgi:hypothetical protein
MLVGFKAVVKDKSFCSFDMQISEKQLYLTFVPEKNVENFDRLENILPTKARWHGMKDMSTQECLTCCERSTSS